MDNPRVRRGERELRGENPESERLCYFLRHHPAKDTTFASKGEPGGWFKYTDVLPWMRHMAEVRLDAVVASSRSFVPPHAHRFESRLLDGEKWIRARYGHSFDTSFADIERDGEDEDMPTLTELLLKQIVVNMPVYLPKLSELGDGSLITALFMKYKRATGGNVSNKVLKSFLLPQVTTLDFKGILIEDSIIRLLPKSCPSLYSLSFEGCFTCMTDTNLQFILKRCTELRQLELSGCSYLTSTGMLHISKMGTKLNLLSLRWIKAVNTKIVSQICAALPDLELLNVTGCLCLQPNDLKKLRTNHPNVFIQYDLVDQSEGTANADDVDDMAEFAHPDEEEEQQEDVVQLPAPVNWEDAQW